MRPRLSWIALVSLLASACGDEPPEVNWGSHLAVFDAAMAALSRSDLDGLWRYLTPEGKARVENDLRELQSQLRDDATGQEVFRSMREGRPDLPAEEFERARSGTLGDVWRFFLKAKPRPPNPKKGMIRLEPDGRTAYVGYLDAQGTERVVKLTKSDGRWRIEELHL